MGCDIHLYKEKQVGGKWLAADEWQTDDYGGLEVPWEKRFTDRNYQLFGLLSKGVREDHEYAFEQRGMPFNASHEVAKACENWDCDGHSHSYLYLHELKDLAAFLEAQTIRISGMKEKDDLAKLRDSIGSGNPDWELIFPYCRWGSSPTLEEFEVDVPAIFYVGDGLRRIIDSFDGIKGDNHRIVFWFDN